MSEVMEKVVKEVVKELAEMTEIMVDLNIASVLGAVTADAVAKPEHVETLRKHHELVIAGISRMADNCEKITKAVGINVSSR